MNDVPSPAPRCPLCLGPGLCPECRGFGAAACPSCDGLGCDECDQSGHVDCVPCGATGICRRCGGAGTLPRAS